MKCLLIYNIKYIRAVSIERYSGNHCSSYLKENFCPLPFCLKQHRYSTALLEQCSVDIVDKGWTCNKYAEHYFWRKKHCIMVWVCNATLVLVQFVFLKIHCILSYIRDFYSRFLLQKLKRSWIIQHESHLNKTVNQQ